MDENMLRELRETNTAVAGLELAVWAAMRAIFETNAEAAFVFRETAPALLGSLKGADARVAAAEAQRHIDRWMQST